MTGKIFNIQKFCTNDGPGIRTTVFVKGCPLKCIWCHNPESQSIANEIMYNSKKCISCFRCVEKCVNGCHLITANKHVYDRTKCIRCGECTGCDALEISGRSAETEDIINEVLKDKPFYDTSGGGITLSGGEPLYQPEFCLALLKKAQESGLHICMETCGFAAKDIVKKTAEFVDIYLFDIKEINPQKHKAYTGADNKIITENLKMLDEMNKNTILRCPIIPTLNDTKENLEGIAVLANSLKNVMQIEIEPYHSIGESKYHNLNRAYSLENIQMSQDTTVKLWISEMQKFTKTKVIMA